jgi:hypothetical protein
MACNGFTLQPTLHPRRSMNVTSLAGAAGERDIESLAIRLLGSPDRFPKTYYLLWRAIEIRCLRAIYP